VPWNDAVFAVLTVLLGYVVLGLSGFGSALVIVPLLTWHWPLTLVVPLVLLIDVPSSLLHTGLNVRQVAWREIPRLILPMVIGALLGMRLLAYASSDWPLLLLGLYIAAIGLLRLRSSVQIAPTPQTRWAWPAGFAMGFVETMFGTAGPVVVAWLSRRLPDPAILRATLPMTIVIVAMLAIGASAVGGQMKQPLLWTAWVVLLPVALLGVVLGHNIARHVPAERLRRVIFSLLVLSGAVLVGRSFMSMLG
jgi:uncharacterized membrane protein YfcA